VGGGGSRGGRAGRGAPWWCRAVGAGPGAGVAAVRGFVVRHPSFGRVARGALAPPPRAPRARVVELGGAARGSVGGHRTFGAIRPCAAVVGPGGPPYCGPPVASLPAGCVASLLARSPGGLLRTPAPRGPGDALNTIVVEAGERFVVVRRHRRGRGEGLRSRKGWRGSCATSRGAGRPGARGGKSGWQGGGSARPGRPLKDHGSSGKNPGQNPFSAR
jgi:hypothetical protein